MTPDEASELKMLVDMLVEQDRVVVQAERERAEIRQRIRVLIQRATQPEPPSRGPA